MYVLYHKDCPDGFAAWWVFHNHFQGNLKGIPAGYRELPDISTIEPGSQVYILDYSPKETAVEALLAINCNVILLDHHDSTFTEFHESPLRKHNNFYFLCDTEYSGAMLAWRFCHGPDSKPPLLVQYVQDYDLWRFKLEESRSINAAIQSYPFELGVYTDINTDLSDATGFYELAAAGEGIERKLEKMSDSIIRSTERWIVIDGHRVPIVNAPYELASKVATKLSEIYKDAALFAASYFDSTDGRRVYNLRTVHDDFKTNDVAAKFGGGGHPKASAFSVGNDSYLRSI